MFTFYNYHDEYNGLQAEVKALITGLRLCIHYDFLKFGAGEDFIHFINKQVKGPWNISYIEEINRLMKKMQLNFTHIWIEENAAADWLVNIRYKEREQSYY